MRDVTRGLGGVEFVEGRRHRHLVGDGVEVGRGCPVTARDTADGGREWLVTGYEEARDFLRDHRFSRAVLAEAQHPRGPATRMSVTDLDPPSHTRIRALIGGAFSARRTERLRGHVERTAEELLDGLIAAAPTADLLADLCAPLTFAAQAELLGVPASRRTAIRELATARLGAPGASRTEVYRGELLLHEEVSALLADTDDPPTGLFAELLSAHRDRGLLDATELTGVAASLFFDGHALAAAQIANAVLCALSRPGLLAGLDRRPDLLAGVVEESLRYSPSVNFSMTRVATSAVRLAGARIEPGDRVTALLPVANRDDAAFADPRRFAPDRTRARHLSFGHGTHHCLGAHLARVEMRAALRALARRAPRLSLALDERDLAWAVTPTMRTLTALPVRWNAPTRSVARG
ncbi:cytochrome P450 [Actinosynnema sp. NPDC059797]